MVFSYLKCDLAFIITGSHRTSINKNPFFDASFVTTSSLDINPTVEQAQNNPNSLQHCTCWCISGWVHSVLTTHCQNSKDKGKKKLCGSGWHCRQELYR